MTTRSKTDVAVDAQTNDRRVRGKKAREVLLVGEFPSRLLVELSERGATVTSALTCGVGFEYLAQHTYDVVVVNALVDGCGTDFVNAVKEDDVAHERTVATLYGARGGALFLRDVKIPSQETLEHLRVRYRATPFVIPSLPGSWDYSVIISPPRGSFMYDERKLPMATTIMTVEPASWGGGQNVSA